MQEIFFEETTKSATNTGRRTLLRQEGERTPLVPLQVCAGWAEIVNSHAHPRILLPQNRCLPEPLTAPFPHQPEPRCNTLDFASKVVCQRAFRRSLDSPQDTEYRNERYFRERRAKTESLREIRRYAILLQEL